MSKIILQPSGNKHAKEHYSDTILNPVSLDRIEQYIDEIDFENLTQIYPAGKAMVWGVTPSGNNITKWNKIESGDITLFSKEGAIFSSGVTTYKLHSKSLAEYLWKFDSKGQTWEYIYFIEEVKKHNIPYLDFNRAVGYAENNIIQGFNVLKPKQSSSVLKAFDLESDVFIETISQEEYIDTVDKLNDLEETESEVTSLRRLEQGYLKKHLFGNKTIASCACCHNNYPVSYIVTAHIKKRAFCNSQEKRDKNVVMPMCKFGCDELFEKGYISVKNGKFVSLKKRPTSPVIERYISNLKNNTCDYYANDSSLYFDWHLNHHS